MSTAEKNFQNATIVAPFDGQISQMTGDVGTRTAPAMRPLEVDGLALDVYELDTRASLTLRALGTPEPLATGGFTEQQCVNLEGMTPAFAIGVGAFGDNFSDCRARFGELISVGGAKSRLL